MKCLNGCLTLNLLDVFGCARQWIWAVGAAAGQYMHRPVAGLQQQASGEEISCIAHVGEAAAPVPWHSLVHPRTFSEVSFPGQHLPLGLIGASGNMSHKQQEGPLGQCITHAGTKTSCLITQQ